VDQPEAGRRRRRARDGQGRLGGPRRHRSRLREGEARVQHSHTFVNATLEGCTPGFWQGGNSFETAGGQWLWNETNDPQWTSSGGTGTNPFIHTTTFNSYVTPVDSLAGKTMIDLVGTGGVQKDVQKAARSLVAAYLNASWGVSYPYSTAELSAKRTSAVQSGEFLALHTEPDAANNANKRMTAARPARSAPR
jgi:hypothetical protein